MIGDIVLYTSFAVALIYLGWLLISLSSDEVGSSSDTHIIPSTIEDPKQQEARKKVAIAFEAQQQQLRARALKPHDPTCKDSWTCNADPCFKREPDKIVVIRTVKAKTKAQRLKEKKKKTDDQEKSMRRLKYGLEEKREK